MAAGHPLTAQAGVDALRAGGNAVDAAVAAMLTSWVAEPLLSGPGAGGYMLVAGAGEEPVLLDFFVAAPGYGADGAQRAPLVPVEVDFAGDARQVFHVGAASCGTYGNPAGIDAAMRALGLAAARRARRARGGARARRASSLNAQQAEVVHLLEAILRSTPEVAALYAPGGAAAARGRALPLPRARRHDRAPRRRGRGAVLQRRHRRRGRRLGRRGRRRADRRGPAPLRGDRARAADGPLPRPRRADEPAAVGRRHPARRCRCGCSTRRRRRRRSRSSCARWRRRSPRARRSSSRGSATRLRGAPARLAHGLDDAHLGRRRRRPRVLGDVHERRGLGRRRARHRHPPQQHHGRGGPQPARLPPRAARAADAVDDVADGRRSPAARSSSRSARRAPTASARRCCRRSSGSSTTA